MGEVIKQSQKMTRSSTRSLFLRDKMDFEILIKESFIVLYWRYLWNEISAFRKNAFFQLIIRHKIKLSFISETEEGAKDKIAERATERERELGSGGYSVGCKMDR